MFQEDLHKLREAMAAGNDGVTLSGTVEVDGAYFGGHVRPVSRKEHRKNRRLAANRDADRRVGGGPAPAQGRHAALRGAQRGRGRRHRPRPCGWRGSELHADEAPHWDALEAFYSAQRINHSEAYSWDSACTNQAESYFSRMRRAVFGQHHHVSKQYLHQYANEMAWREDAVSSACIKYDDGST